VRVNAALERVLEIMFLVVGLLASRGLAALQRAAGSLEHLAFLLFRTRLRAGFGSAPHAVLGRAQCGSSWNANITSPGTVGTSLVCGILSGASLLAAASCGSNYV